MEPMFKVAFGLVFVGLATHPASALVHVCDVFDALRTSRPHRDALSTAHALSLIEEGTGRDFDTDVARVHQDDESAGGSVARA